MQITEAQPDSGSLTMQFLCKEFGIFIFCLRGLKKFKKNILQVGSFMKNLSNSINQMLKRDM